MGRAKRIGSGLRVRKLELFRYLGYAPHPGQVEVHRSKAPRRVLVTGVRWGKSTAAVMEAVAALLEPREESTGWICGPSYDHAERIFSAVVHLVEERFPHRLLELNLRERRIVVRNLSGGTSGLRAKSADNPTSLLGAGLDWLIVDEAARLRDDIWQNYLSQRLVDRRGWALFLSTPRGCNWFYRLYRRGCGFDPQFASWCSPSWENPHLDRAVIEAEQDRLPPEVYAQEFAAEFLGTDVEPCLVCGGPSRDAAGICLIEAGEVLPECAECGEPVNAEGRTLVRLTNGQPDLVVIVLDPCPEISEENEPEFPAECLDGASD